MKPDLSAPNGSLNTIPTRPPIDTGRPSHIVALMRTLTAVIYPAPRSKWLVAYNPETGTTTQGRTQQEALSNLKEATELYLSEFPSKVKSTGRAVMTTFEVAAHA